jgi:hypothetical protein
MKHNKMATLVVAGALTLGVGVGAAPANAATPTTSGRDLTAEKARCTTMIDVRLTALARLDTTLSGAKQITDAHRSTQTSSNTAAASGLGSLKTKIAADADAATLATDCKSIVEGYRVFALRAPQTHIVIAGDAESAAVTALNAAVPKLSDAIDKAAAAGKDVTAARAALADLQIKVADAATQANGVADAVIGLVPADYNANHGVLDSAHSAVKAGAVDLKAARADVKTIASSVKA